MVLACNPELFSLCPGHNRHYQEGECNKLCLHFLTGVVNNYRQTGKLF